jgi:hypothetical protein
MKKVLSILLIYTHLLSTYNNKVRLSKSDSVPVRGDGYKPRSFRPRANAEMLYSRAGGPGGGCVCHRA